MKQREHTWNRILQSAWFSGALVIVKKKTGSVGSGKGGTINQRLTRHALLVRVQAGWPAYLEGVGLGIGNANVAFGDAAGADVDVADGDTVGVGDGVGVGMIFSQ